MKRLRCLWILAWMAVLPDVGHADPPDPTPPDQVQQVSLLRHNPFAQFHLLLGRPQIDAVRFRKGSQTNLLSPTHALGDSRTVLRESISTTSVRGMPTMHYTLAGDTFKVSIDVSSAGVWTIDSLRQISGETQHVQCMQKPNHPIELICQSSLPELKIKASTWLHLREADRLVFDIHLLPLIEQMISPYQFEALADTARDYAVQQHADAVVKQQRVSELIAMLSSENRSQRVLAYRELGTLGLELLPYLERLDHSSLDAEQKIRICELRRQLQPRDEDSPERLAVLLSYDATYWKVANARLSEGQRLVITHRFQGTGRNIQVQPDASLTRVATNLRD